MNRVMCAFLLLASACNCGERPRAAPSAPAQRAEPPAPAPEPTESVEPPPPAPPGPRLETSRYVITTETVGDRYAMGRPGKLTVTLRAAEGYRIHPELPLYVGIRAPSGMGIGKTAFERGDALRATEQEAQFEVPLRPTQTGEANVDASLRFAICQGDVCEPRDERVMLSLTVE